MLGHVYADVRIMGAKGEATLKNAIIDTGVSYTALPKDVIEKVHAWALPRTIELELGDGRTVKTDTYAVIIGVEDREAATIAVGFKEAKPVVGVRTLEDLGLKVDPTSGKLEPTRPKGLAYFYKNQKICKISARE